LNARAKPTFAHAKKRLSPLSFLVGSLEAIKCELNVLRLHAGAAMAKFLFWNPRGRHPEQALVRLAVRHDLDILILAEFAIPEKLI
jgi:hypothetical protein